MVSIFREDRLERRAWHQNGRKSVWRVRTITVKIFKYHESLRIHSLWVKHILRKSYFKSLPERKIALLTEKRILTWPAAQFGLVWDWFNVVITWVFNSSNVLHPLDEISRASMILTISYRSSISSIVFVELQAIVSSFQWLGTLRTHQSGEKDLKSFSWSWGAFH